MEKQFEENFEQVYSKVYDLCAKRLEEVKRKNNKFVLIILAIFSVMNIVIYFISETKSIITLTISISFCVILILIISGKQNYKRIYKKLVIEGLVKGYDEKFDFTPNMGVTRNDYEFSGFDTSFDSYYSEDKISGMLEDGERFQMSEVATYDVSKYRDENGNVSKTETLLFRGIYGKVILRSNISSNIYIAVDSSTRKFSKNRLEVDSAEFEKYYDCITTDKIKAMQIFTSDLIEKYVSIAKINKFSFELKIENDNMYFRYKCGQVFEPPTFKNGLDKEFLKKYYKIIYYPLEIIKSTVVNINSVIE